MTTSDENSTITVRVSSTFKEEIEETARERGFNSRSDYIRFALRKSVAEETTLPDEVIEGLRESREQLESGDYTRHESPPDALVDDSSAETVLTESSKSSAATGVLPTSVGDDGEERSDPDSSPRNEWSAEMEPDTALVGCGGAGMNLVNSFLTIESRVGEWAETLVIDTDKDDLNESLGDTTARLGQTELEKFEETLGKDRRPKMFESFSNAVHSTMGPADHVFVLTGLGGETGTYLSPYVAKIAAQEDTTVTSIVTLPFRVENKRVNRAHDAIEPLAEASDTMVVIDGSSVGTTDEWVPLGERKASMNSEIVRILTQLWSSSDFHSLGREKTIPPESVFEIGGVSALVDEWFPPNDVPTKLDATYTNHAVSTAEANHAILLVEAPKSLSEDDVDDVVAQLGSGLDDVWYSVIRTSKPDDTVSVTGFLVDIEVDLADLVPEAESDLEFQIVPGDTSTTEKSESSLPPTSHQSAQ